MNAGRPEKENANRILLVDDESYISSVIREMLEDYGYEVDIMSDSAQAFAHFKENGSDYGMVITDYALSGIKGDELIRKIQEIRPGLPAVLCSGVPLPVPVTRQITTASILIKPFDLEDLLELVGESVNPSVP